MKKIVDRICFQRYGWLPLLILGIAFLGIGCCLEQFREIFIKATRICLECIGIG